MNKLLSLLQQYGYIGAVKYIQWLLITEGVYSVTSEKQSLMMSQYMTYQIEKNINPDAKLTWNETGKSCTEWADGEFLQLVLEIKTYVYPLVSYQQQLEEQIMNCTNQEELDGIIINYNLVNLEN